MALALSTERDSIESSIPKCITAFIELNAPNMPPSIAPSNESVYISFFLVHITTDQDELPKKYIRMRNDHRLALKKIKQQIHSFCLRHGYRFYEIKSHWPQAHSSWLRFLKPEGLYKEILKEYLLTYEVLTDKIDRLDKRIEELASDEHYNENVHKLCCFIGVKPVY